MSIAQHGGVESRIRAKKESKQKQKQKQKQHVVVVAVDLAYIEEGKNEEGERRRESPLSTQVANPFSPPEPSSIFRKTHSALILNVYFDNP